MQSKSAEGGEVQEKGDWMDLDNTGSIVNISKNLLRHYGEYCLEPVTDLRQQVH